MTLKQKRLLILVGVLNILIVIALISVVFAHTRPQPAPSRQLLPCTTALLTTLPASLHPNVSWEATELYISLTAEYAISTPPDESAQLLWAVLDQITDVVTSGCPSPTQITVLLEARGQTSSLHHQARITGETLSSWMSGNLTSDALAANAQYRVSSRPHPIPSATP